MCQTADDAVGLTVISAERSQDETKLIKFTLYKEINNQYRNLA